MHGARPYRARQGARAALRLSRLLGRGLPQDGLQDALPPARSPGAGWLAPHPRLILHPSHAAPHIEPHIKKDFMTANPRSELSQRMMGSAIAMLAVVGVIAYFIYTGKILPDEPVSFTVTPTQTGMLVPGKPIAVDIAVRLENNSKEGLVLNAP